MKAKLDTDLNAEDLKVIIEDYKKLVKKETGKPTSRRTRLSNCCFHAMRCLAPWNTPKAIYYRRMEKIPDAIGTAANVQAMVFGNMGDTSGTGVGFTRNPSTGEQNSMASSW